jgi:hypothetical protein
MEDLALWQVISSSLPVGTWPGGTQINRGADDRDLKESVSRPGGFIE